MRIARYIRKIYDHIECHVMLCDLGYPTTGKTCKEFRQIREDLVEGKSVLGEFEKRNEKYLIEKAKKSQHKTKRSRRGKKNTNPENGLNTVENWKNMEGVVSSANADSNFSRSLLRQKIHDVEQRSNQIYGKREKRKRDE